MTCGGFFCNQEIQPIVLLAIRDFFKKRSPLFSRPNWSAFTAALAFAPALDIIISKKMVHIKGRRLDLNLSDRAHITAASFPERGTPKAPEECRLKAISEKVMHRPEETRKIPMSCIFLTVV